MWQPNTIPRPVLLVCATVVLLACNTSRAVDPYDTWASTHFGSPFSFEAGISENPDGDDASNLLEFTFNSLPGDARNRPKVHYGTRLIYGVNSAYIRYQRPTTSSFSPVFTLKPQASTDLIQWEGLGGSLNLRNIVDPNSTPSTPGFQWHLAWVPIDGPQSVYLRIEVHSRSALWHEVLKQQEQINTAILMYAIVNNLTGAEELCWSCARHYLPADSPFREGPVVDAFGNPFVFLHVYLGVDINPNTLAEAGQGTQPAQHLYNWETLCAQLARQHALLNQALLDYKQHYHYSNSDPVHLDDIIDHLDQTPTTRFTFASGQVYDPAGNAYIIGPAIGHGVSFNAATLQLLGNAGWLDSGFPKIVRSPQELLDELLLELRILSSLQDQYAISNNKLPTDSVTLANIAGYLSGWPTLGKNTGQDFLGNYFLIGPQIRDAPRINPLTVNYLASTDISDRLTANLAAIQMHRDMMAMIGATTQYLGDLIILRGHLSQPLSWALIRPHLDTASTLYQSGGRDPFGRQYVIGPTIADFVLPHPVSMLHLEEMQVFRGHEYSSLSAADGEIYSFVRELSMLNQAANHYYIESNETGSLPLHWPLVAQYLGEYAGPRLLLRGGADNFGRPILLVPSLDYARFSQESIVQLNTEWGGRSAGNLCTAAYLMEDDLSAAATLLEQFRVAHSLPTSASVSWPDLLPWLDTLPIADLFNFHRAYGWDSLGNRPVIGPTFADPVLPNPASIAAITAAGIPLPP